jgi:hypothetical protein
LRVKTIAKKNPTTLPQITLNWPQICCHVHRFAATLTLTARSTGLPCRLVTWHPTIPPLPHFAFSSNV